MDVEKAELPYISNNEFTVSSKSIIQNGDVIIADAAEDETVGKCSEIKGTDGLSLVSGLHTIPCRPNKKFASGYLGYFMNSIAFHNQLLPLIQGTKISSISKSALQNTDIFYPNSEQEQLQIGQFLHDLDNLITLHRRKPCFIILLFEDHKEVVPYDWEQRKLGDVVDIRGGRDYKHLSNGDIPVYGTGGYMLSVNEALSYDEDAIGIGRKGTIDKPYILNAPFWTVDTLFYAVPRDKYDLNLVFDIFQTIDWKKKDESTGVPSLSKTAINSIEVRTPNYQEQKIIGNFFATLDNLITLHQRKPFCPKEEEIMQNQMNNQSKFCDYYAKWIDVYKKGAVRKVTMSKYLMTHKVQFTRDYTG